MDALNNAVVACKSDEAKLPKNSNEPNFFDIKTSVLECGFRPSDASPDAGCGASNTVTVSSTSTEPTFINAEPVLIKTGRWLEGIAYDGKNIWTADSGQRTVAEINFNTHEVARTYKVGRLPIELVVGRNGEVFSLIATDKKIIRHNRYGNMATLTTFTECVDGMVGDNANDSLWILASKSCGSSNSSLIKVNARSGAQTQSVDLGEWSTSLVEFDTDVWVSNARRAEITIVNKNTLRAKVMLVPGSELWKLVANSNYIFGAGRRNRGSDEGLVVKINPFTFIVENEIILPEMIVQIAIGEHYVYAIGKSGEIWILEKDSLNIARTVTVKLPNAKNGKYEPSDALFFEDILVVASRMFYGSNGQLLTNSSGNEDDNGGILLFTNIAPIDVAPNVSLRKAVGLKKITNPNGGSSAVRWIHNPQDPRANRRYDMVANAYWGICERDDLNPNSPRYNNESAFWDCADAGQIDGGGTLAPLISGGGSNVLTIVTRAFGEATE